MSCKSNIFI